MTFAEVRRPIVPPWPLRSGLEAAARALFELDDRSRADFSRPIGEPGGPRLSMRLPADYLYRAFN